MFCNKSVKSDGSEKIIFYTLDFSGNATSFTGTTRVASGTFTLAESAKLGTGSFDVSGTLVLEGARHFANPVTGGGKIKTNGAITL